MRTRDFPFRRECRRHYQDQQIVYCRQQLCTTVTHYLPRNGPQRFIQAYQLVSHWRIQCYSSTRRWWYRCFIDHERWSVRQRRYGVVYERQTGGRGVISIIISANLIHEGVFPGALFFIIIDSGVIGVEIDVTYMRSSYLITVMVIVFSTCHGAFFRIITLYFYRRNYSTYAKAIFQPVRKY